MLRRRQSLSQGEGLFSPFKYTRYFFEHSSIHRIILTSNMGRWVKLDAILIIVLNVLSCTKSLHTHIKLLYIILHLNQEF